MGKRFIILLTILFVCVLIMAGCSNNKEDTANNTDDESEEETKVELKQDTPEEALHTFLDASLHRDEETIKAVLTEPHLYDGEEQEGLWEIATAYGISEGKIYGDYETDSEVFLLPVIDMYFSDIEDPLKGMEIMKFVKVDEKWYHSNSENNPQDGLDMLEIQTNDEVAEMKNIVNTNNSRFLEKHPEYEKFLQ